MKLAKYKTREEELRAKFEEDMAKLREQERAEREKMITPIADKFAKVAGEEVGKLLEANPDLAQSFTFRKRKVASVLAKAIGDLIGAGDGEDDDEGGSDETQDETKESAVISGGVDTVDIAAL